MSIKKLIKVANYYSIKYKNKLTKKASLSFRDLSIREFVKLCKEELEKEFLKLEKRINFFELNLEKALQTKHKEIRLDPNDFSSTSSYELKLKIKKMKDYFEYLKNITHSKNEFVDSIIRDRDMFPDISPKEAVINYLSFSLEAYSYSDEEYETDFEHNNYESDYDTDIPKILN